MRVVVTGGAGFLGSHLCQTLLERGDEVVCVDDLSSGTVENVAPLLGSSRFSFYERDVRNPLNIAGPVDAVANLASLASPPAYLRRPVFTLTTGSEGTKRALDLALSKKARFVQTSTSEVYGDPLVHPQREEYWGNVNPIGERSVYDEAKRYAEALIFAYRRSMGLNTGVVRIFNTYGPRMRADDGRVITNFTDQALRGQPLTVYGDGRQTRSLCYVDDLIRGLVCMIDCDAPGPVNIGNPQELTVLEIANTIIRITESRSSVEFRPLPSDDPTRRRPDISLAKNVLGWSPRIPLEVGLSRTISWHRTRLDATKASVGETMAEREIAVA